MSRIFKQYNRSDDVVMIPDLPPPLPLVPDDTQEGGLSALTSAQLEAIASQTLEQAQQEAQHTKEKLLALAQSEREALLQAATEEAEQIRERARREGAEQGTREKKEEIEQSLKGMVSTLSELRKQQEAFFQESEQGLKLLAADIAEKLIEKKIEEDDTVLIGLVKQAVQSIRDADWISVEVSANLPQLAAALEKELGQETGGTRLEVALRDLPDGGCWIQIPDGAVDASLATQVANLKEIFSHMDEA